MRCGQCQFENLPGLERCFQCGAVLGEQEAIDIYPPRMNRWRRPFRSFVRWIRRQRDNGTGPVQTPKEKAKSLKHRRLLKAMLVAILSIVPGLGHLVAGQYKRVWWCVGVWAGLVCLGLVLYGSMFGTLAIGCAAGMHIWIALYWPEEAFLRGHRRFWLIVLGFILASLAYSSVFRIISRTSLAAVRITFGVSSMKINEGDVLLVRRNVHIADDIHRGVLVTANMPIIGLGGTISDVVVQVVGLPQDTVEIKGNRFFVNGMATDPNVYTIPQWLVGRSLSAVVPPGHVFVRAAYGRRLPDRYNDRAIAISLVQEQNITGIVFIRWWPIWRRGYIAEQ